MEKVEPSYIAGGDVRWCQSGKQFRSSSKSETVTKWPGNSTPKYTTRRNENIQPHKNLCANIHSSIIHNSQRVERIQMSVNLGVGYSFNGILLNNSKRSSVQCYSMDEPWKDYAKSKKPGTKDHILCDSIYLKCPEQANPQRQKADRWLPADGEKGKGEWLLLVTGLLFGVMETFWN